MEDDQRTTAKSEQEAYDIAQREAARRAASNGRAGAPPHPPGETARGDADVPPPPLRPLDNLMARIDAVIDHAADLQRQVDSVRLQVALWVGATTALALLVGLMAFRLWQLTRNG